MRGSDTTLAGLQHCARCCQLSRELPITAAGSRCGAVQVFQLRSAADAVALCAGAAKQGEQRIDKPACSPDDDACAHPFSGWQVQVEKDEASCFVRGAPVWVLADTDPCNVLQVGLHCRSQVGSCRGVNTIASRS